jgi:hypothetical protein
MCVGGAEGGVRIISHSIPFPVWGGMAAAPHPPHTRPPPYSTHTHTQHHTNNNNHNNNNNNNNNNNIIIIIIITPHNGPLPVHASAVGPIRREPHGRERRRRRLPQPPPDQAHGEGKCGAGRSER